MPVDLVDPQALGDRLVDRLARVQRAGRVLEHDLHLAPVLAQRLRGARERRALEPDLAARGQLEAEERPGERRLAAAGLADERDDLARHDLEVDAVDRARRRRVLRRRDRLLSNVTCRSLTSMIGPSYVGSSASRHRRLTDPDARRTCAADRPASSGGSAVGARVDRLRAAGDERAARRQLARVGRVAGEPERRLAEAHVADGRERRGERLACTGAAGSPNTPSRRPFLDDAAGVHDRQALAARREHREVVGDEHHREAERRPAAARAARAPGPAPSRRARWSARRR